MISATGRSPAIAAPIAEPAIAVSEIGVLRTRPAPNRSSRPSVVLNTPPEAMSSPSSTTRSSRAISCPSAAATACRYVSSAIGNLRRSTCPSTRCPQPAVGQPAPRTVIRSISAAARTPIASTSSAATPDADSCAACRSSGSRSFHWATSSALR